MSDVPSEKIALSKLTRKQRRVLGVLLEKAFTTPDQYPLTLKATTTGCNQKNNREPLSSYDEDTVHDTLEELREIGFVGCLHTESGRTERYRHYLRHRTELSEQQLAVMTELMLRGKQQLGELRTRASRMVPIDTLEVLRAAMQPLLEQGLIRTNGPLERRGIDVDHNLYPLGENHEPLGVLSDEPPAITAAHAAIPSRAAVTPSASSTTPTPNAAPLSSETRAAAPSPADAARLTALTQQVTQLHDELRELRATVEALTDTVADLRRQLGG